MKIAVSLKEGRYYILIVLNTFHESPVKEVKGSALNWAWSLHGHSPEAWLAAAPQYFETRHYKKGLSCDDIDYEPSHKTHEMNT